MLQCPALAGPTGPAFSFSALPTSLWGGGWLLAHPGFPLSLDSSTTGSHWPNRAGNPSCWCPFPYSAPKIAHRATQGLFSFVLSLLHFSPMGKSWPVPETVLSRFAGFVHKRLTLAQQGRSWAFAGAVSPTRPSKPLTGASLGLPLFLEVFLLRQRCQVKFQLVIHRFLNGVDCKSKITIPHHPSFVRTLVGSVSIKRFSSSCRMYLATVLALIPVCWKILPMLGQYWWVFLSSQKIK